METNHQKITFSPREKGEKVVKVDVKSQTLNKVDLTNENSQNAQQDLGLSI